MRSVSERGLIFGLTLVASVGCALTAPRMHAQMPATLRAPATPLVVHDPYFSVWSTTDKLTGGATRHWTGEAQPMNAMVRVDGKNFRVLGDGAWNVPAMEETARRITPTRTIVDFANAQIAVKLTFFTPALPGELKVMARPVTYLEWEVASRDGAEHQVTLYFDVDGAIAVNRADEPVVWSRGRIDGMSLLRVGSQKQPILEQWGDNLRINWGYFYLGVPDGENAETLAGNEEDRGEFLKTGELTKSDDLEQPRMPQSRHPASPVLAVALPLGKVGAQAVRRHLLLAYDDIYSVEYMHQKLLPYWRTQFATFADLLQGAEREHAALETRAAAFDEELERDLTADGGQEYAAISILAFRQAIAAHKLVEDASGVPFFMPKENFSNGSISTVDVLYPSAPMFLFLNPALVRAQMVPVLRYAETGRWKFPFAPHDLGVYPLANGQLYGGGEVTEDDQMPVEESGNLILMAAALSHAEGNTEFAGAHWAVLTRWAEYLMEKGFDPENQLCTDDFAGHLAHNANLSIKAIEALAAYGQMAGARGDKATAEKYTSAAKQMAARWTAMAADGDHYKLAFDKDGTWSQKYNLVWDRILGLKLFPDEVAVKETAFYRAHLNKYGLPLDNRATYTKLDWTVWSASLSQRREDFEAIVHPVWVFLNETPDRVPMSDWYDTRSAKEVAFQARSVVGGVYIRMLEDEPVWKKWVERAEK